ASGAALFMLLVKWIKPATKEDTDYWIEINSQILNAAFTLNALIVAPSRMLNWWRITVYWWVMRKIGSGKGGHGKVGDGTAGGSIEPLDEKVNVVVPKLGLDMAKELERVYTPMRLLPLNLRSGISSTTTGSNIELESAESSSDDNVNTKVADTVPLRPLRTWIWLITLLNLQCVFQWPITIVMWGYGANYQSRPSYIVYGFLPLSFLTGTVGGIWLGMISGKIKKDREALVHGEGGAGGDDGNDEGDKASV
ncbi:hypothetical protein HDU76_011013, partial [Blyttiomyces sp. JEL0837]